MWRAARARSEEAICAAVLGCSSAAICCACDIGGGEATTGAATFVVTGAEAGALAEKKAARPGGSAAATAGALAMLSESKAVDRRPCAPRLGRAARQRLARAVATPACRGTPPRSRNARPAHWAGRRARQRRHQLG